METLSPDAQALIRCKPESDRARWIDRVKKMTDSKVMRLLAAEMPVLVPIQPIVAQVVVPPPEVHDDSGGPERRPRKRIASHYTPLEGTRRVLYTEEDIEDDHRTSVVMKAARSMASLQAASTIEAAVNAASAQHRASVRLTKTGVGSLHATPFNLSRGIQARFNEICAKHNVPLMCSEPFETLELFAPADDDGDLR